MAKTVYVVELEGPVVDHVARQGVNLDRKGRPQPYRAKAQRIVLLEANSPAEAKAVALTNEGDDGVFKVKSCRVRKQ